jgi:hypothetical protein
LTVKASVTIILNTQGSTLPGSKSPRETSLIDRWTNRAQPESRSVPALASRKMESRVRSTRHPQDIPLHSLSEASLFNSCRWVESADSTRVARICLVFKYWQFKVMVTIVLHESCPIEDLVEIDKHNREPRRHSKLQLPTSQRPERISSIP